MYTLTIAQAIGIALLSVCPLAQPGLPATSTDLFGRHQLTTDYGLMRIQVGSADKEEPSALAVGTQYISIRNAPLARVLEFMDLPISPCPLTPYDFGPPLDDEAPAEEKTGTANALLAEMINFKISCSDCQLEDLQMVAFEFLRSKISAREIPLLSLPMLRNGSIINRDSSACSFSFLLR